MGSMMIFRNSRFIWLVELKRSSPRRRRLPRNLLPKQNIFLLTFAPSILSDNCKKCKIKKNKILFMFGSESARSKIFFGNKNVPGFC